MKVAKFKRIFKKPHKIRQYFDEFIQKLNLWVNILIVSVLADDKFRIVAVMDGKNCPVLDFLTVGEASTSSVRAGLIEMLTHVAENGLQGAPSKWFHEADKASGIFEFIKGPLRLFFFKGNGRDIAVCTIGVRKSGQKADGLVVKASVRWKKDYVSAVVNGTYEVINDED